MDVEHPVQLGNNEHLQQQWRFAGDLLCLLLGVAKSSYYDYLRQRKQKAQGHKGKKPGPKVQHASSAATNKIPFARVFIFATEPWHSRARAAP